MRLQLSLVVSALAIIATSCSKEKITPNTPASPNSGTLNTVGDVVVFDHSGPQSIDYRNESGAGVLSNASNDIGSSAPNQQFDPAGQTVNSTGVVFETTADENPDIVIP